MNRSQLRLWFCLSLLFTGVRSTLAEDAYTAAGIPVDSAEWRGAEYKTLLTLVTESKVPLPRMSDKDGERVLKKFSSEQALSFWSKKSLPISFRLGEYLDLQSSAGAMLMQYATKYSADKTLGQEMALLHCHLLRTSALGIDLVDEFIPTLEKDESYPTRMAGLEKMKSGLSSVFSGTYRSVAEDATYTPQQCSDILAETAKTAPRFASLFTKDFKHEMALKYKKLEAQVTSDQDKASVAAILKALGD